MVYLDGAQKTAIPSGKLCMLIPTAVMIPLYSTVHLE